MLTEDQVEDIKADAKRMTQKAVAAKHGISRSCVSDIVTGRRHAKGTVKKAKPTTYDPTNDRIQELEAEVLHLTEERNFERSRVKANAKTTGLLRAITSDLERKVTPLKPFPKSQVTPGRRAIREHVVLHFSDAHHDSVVRPEECGGLERYDWSISCTRAERLIDTVIDWTQSTLHPQFHFTDLHILAYGDFTTGEIHDNVPRSAFRNQFLNCLAIGKLHAAMYADLAPHFANIHIIYLSGNHGRRTPKKDYGAPQDNWDFLIGSIAQLYCRSLTNVQFLLPNAYSINLDINGVGFHCEHGDDVPGGSVPWYAMLRRQKSLIALNAVGGPTIRYFCMGHQHRQSSLADINGELLINGAWLATDAYSYNSFAGYREPSQLLHGVNPKHGITWRLHVNLKDKSELKGPKRYRVEMPEYGVAA